MKINVIVFSELCDKSFSAMLSNPKTYVSTDTGIYVPPPNKDAKERFNYVMGLFIKKVLSTTDTNIVIRSCKPNENWRLKHVGKRYADMVKSNRFTSVAQNNGMPFEIGIGWEKYFDDYFKSLNFRKIEVPETDTDDIIKILSITEQIELKSEKPVCIVDSNKLIDRTVENIPKYIMTAVNSAYMEAMSEK